MRRVFSVGTHPYGFIHRITYVVLRENKILQYGYSKSIDPFRNQEFDLVITVYDDTDENRLIWLIPGKRVQIGSYDPVKISDTMVQTVKY